MKRRAFVHSAAGLALGLQRKDVSAQSATGFLTLDWFRCRRDQELARMRDFIGDSMVPAYGRCGVKPRSPKMSSSISATSWSASISTRWRLASSGMRLPRGLL